MVVLFTRMMTTGPFVALSGSSPLMLVSFQRVVVTSCPFTDTVPGASYFALPDDSPKPTPSMENVPPGRPEKLNIPGG